MMHAKRRFCAAQVESAEKLAEMLTEYTWTPCSAFFVRGREDVIFANDSTSADGAQEYAVLVNGDGAWRQVESITFGWCTPAKALGYIRKALAGEMSETFERLTPHFEAHADHRGRACCA